LTQKSLYRRPLPDELIPFASEEGRRVFREALATGHMEGFFAVSEQFHTQADPAFCGLGSLVVALNALEIDPGRLWKGPWRWFSEELLDCCAPLLALGYAIGRIGCQVSGDGDYGKAWDGPWAMAYPDGEIPTTEEVHPTPIYETLAMGALAVLLFRRRDAYRPGVLFAFYLVAAGAERFLVEFLRRNDVVAAGLTAPQLESLALLVAGLVWLALAARRGGLRSAAAGT